MSNTTHSLWIINKAGGLIYQKTYSEGLLPQLNSNDYLILAGTFHGIHAISSKLSPSSSGSSGNSNDGIETVEAGTFKISCFQTLTGTKFVIFTSPSHPNPKKILLKLYEIYSSLLKDPFYSIENPIIRNSNFDQACYNVCCNS
ncbi:Sybindin-like protein [Phakopsora pachyrhizi]|uniref:Trafficking protein particle complex subunit n=1 Tax=Phakopsora pachyrhizi TaxID=170000 RepID=A0A0S1MIL9_PHAPC|nr:Sybindin-like protein [Phakopsora pachyrhizi]CAH7669693.1 Sybindin-like protein [Phakopsora pachyrhizi]